MSYNKYHMLEKKNILGVGITNATLEEILEYIIRGLEKNTKKYYIVTPNPEILTLANNDFEYKNILNKAKIALADGVGVIMAGKILGRPLKARVTGVDLLENLCSRVAEKPITVGFLGGKDKIAGKTAECLVSKYPGLKVAFAGEEWPSGNLRDSPALLNDSSNRILAQPSNVAREHFLESGSSEKLFKSSFRKQAHPFGVAHRLPMDILFVAFGAPKQEIWISENLDKIPVKVSIGVGGAFDYISKQVPRAPLSIRKIGLEWFYRLLVQPWRIKRQIALLEFMYLVLKEKLGSKRGI